MVVQIYGDNAKRNTAVYKWVTCFSEGRASVTDEEFRMASNEQN
jgi:hypothetical protein